MQFPFYLRLGPLALQPHWVFEVLAYFVAFRAYLWMRQRTGDPISNRARWWLIAAAATGAAIGSKLLYWFEDPHLSVTHLADPAFLLAGKTIVGGLIGGLIAVEWTKRRLGIRQPTGDLFAVPLCVGIAIGRIGCFLQGLPDHTFGKPTTLPWGVNFGDGIPRHPTQLYESAFVLLLGLLISRLARKPHINGDLFKAFMVGYMIFRLFVDFLKPDVRLAGLSAIQWCCVIILIYYSYDVRRWLFGPHTVSAVQTVRTTSS